MKQHRGSILAGVFLIVIGAWLLAERLGVALPGISQLWPGLIILTALWSLISFFSDRKPDQLFWAVGGTLLGLFFFLFTLGRLEWGRDMRNYWPAFVIIFAIGSFAEWLAAPAHRRTLVMAAIALGIGLFFLAFNLNLIDSALGQQILQFWPVSLIVLGLIVVVQALNRNRNA
jgi:hypothetical protein